ncbi:MAG: type II toxin-antitoxin system antitoxin SocA domain-containing protein [Patescibacteria group bacterium]
MSTYTTDAMSIAKWFVDRANKEFVDEDGVSEGLTNLKLQKLLYFAQAVSLSLKDQPLFNDKIEAWKFGPVIPVVYHALKEFENAPVKITSATQEISPEVASLLENVWSVYGKFSAHELVNITHNHLPWKEVYLSGGKNNEITAESIKKYYADYYHLA